MNNKIEPGPEIDQQQVTEQLVEQADTMGAGLIVPATGWVQGERAYSPSSA